MAGDEQQQPAPERDDTAATDQAAQAPAPVSPRDIPPARWALLGLNTVLFVVCAFALATSPLAPWYRAPNAGAAPLLPTASATSSYLGPVTSTPPPGATSTHTPKPTHTPRSSGGTTPTSTPTMPVPTATPTPVGSSTATPTPTHPMPTNTPCDTCQ